MFGGPSFPLFRVAGFPVRAHWSLLVAVALMGVMHGGMGGVVLSALVFGSVLLHELGHAVVARRRRVSIEGIELHMFGGVAKMVDPPRSPGDEVAIALAGPVVSMLLGVGAGVAAFALGPSAPGWLVWIGGVNLMLGVFNLLPALPMDGGRVLRALLAKRHGLVDGTVRAVRVSRFIALGLAVVGVLTNWWLVALAGLVWVLGNAEKAQMRRHERLWSLGYRDEHFTPWARYERAAQRASQGGPSGRPDAVRGPELHRPDVHRPEVLEPELVVDGPFPGARAEGPFPGGRPPRLVIVRDAFGRATIGWA